MTYVCVIFCNIYPLNSNHHLKLLSTGVYILHYAYYNISKRLRKKNIYLTFLPYIYVSQIIYIIITHIAKINNIMSSVILPSLRSCNTNIYEYVTLYQLLWFIYFVTLPTTQIHRILTRPLTLRLFGRIQRQKRFTF